MNLAAGGPPLEARDVDRLPLEPDGAAGADGFDVVEWAANTDIQRHLNEIWEADTVDEEVGTGLALPQGCTSLGDVVFFKYIDDSTTVETVDRDCVIRHVQASGPTEVVPATVTQELIDKLVDRTEAIGVKINGKKTQVMCVTGDDGYEVECKLRVQNEEIGSSSSIKLLGFCVGSSPGVHDQLDLI